MHDSFSTKCDVAIRTGDGSMPSELYLALTFLMYRVFLMLWIMIILYICTCNFYSVPAAAPVLQYSTASLTSSTLPMGSYTLTFPSNNS